MGLFNSIIKSNKLRKLQRKITTPSGWSSAGFNAEAAFKQCTEEASALDAYYDLCLSDKSTSKMVSELGISREHLDCYYRMIRSEMPMSFDGWIKGHYIPLSSIAYPEPLLFIFRTEMDSEWNESGTVLCLMKYWAGEIPQGGLLELLNC